MAASTHGDVVADGRELLLGLAGDGEAAELGESLLHPLHPRGRWARLTSHNCRLPCRGAGAPRLCERVDERVGEGRAGSAPRVGCRRMGDTRTRFKAAALGPGGPPINNNGSRIERAAVLRRRILCDGEDCFLACCRDFRPLSLFSPLFSAVFWGKKQVTGRMYYSNLERWLIQNLNLGNLPNENTSARSNG